MPKKCTPEEKFDNFINRNGLSISVNLNAYRKTYFRFKDDITSVYWLFKLFLIFEQNGVTKSIETRTRRLIAHNKKSNLTLYAFLLKYGKEKAIEKFDIYRNKQSYSNTYEYKNKHLGWDQDRFERYKKETSITLENMIRKYGEEVGKRKFENYRNKQAFSGVKEDYFIQKYGLDKGKEEYAKVNKRKGHTLDNYIKKYGEIDGPIKLQEFFEKLFEWKEDRIGRSRVSKSSQELFNSLDLLNPENTYFASRNKEFNVFCNNNIQNMYFYDFVDTKAKKCIEYNGDYFHKNPDFYCSQTYADVHERDRSKIEHIKSLGYDVLIVWESEYKSNKEYIKEKCNEFIRT